MEVTLPIDKLDSAEVANFFERIRNNFAAVKERKYEFQHIPGFKSTLSYKHFEKVYAEILNGSLKLQVESLLPGQSIYVKRNKADPHARTYNIVRGIDGEMHLFVEPKSKRLDNIKRRIKYISGGFKTRKIAVRADTPLAEPYVSMVSYLSKDAKGQKFFNNEINIAQLFNGQTGFSKCILGNQTIKGDQYRMVTYAPYKTATLLEYLNGSWVVKQLGMLSQELNTLLRLDIVRQVINIVQKMHRAGIEHKDIKLENFLISFNESTKRFEVEIIDFGLCKKFGESDVVNGTQTYLPPWLAQQYFNNISTDSKEQKELGVIAKLTKTLAYSVLCANRENGEFKVLVTPLPRISGKHDMWSLGIMLYELAHGARDLGDKMWENIQKNNFLNSIFNLGDVGTQYDMWSISSIDVVKMRFEEIFGAYLATLESLSFPLSEIESEDFNIPDNYDEDNPEHVNKKLAHMIKNFDKIMANVPNIFEVPENDQEYLFSAEEVEVAGLYIIVMCPDGELVLDDDDYDEENDQVSTEVFDLVTDAKSIMFDEDDNIDLNEFLQRLLSKRSNIEQQYITAGSLKMDDPSWLEYARWKMFLDAMLIITYKSLQDQKVNTREHKKHKANNRPDYAHEIMSLREDIKDMIAAMLESLGKKSFNSTYAKPRSGI